MLSKYSGDNIGNACNLVALVASVQKMEDFGGYPDGGAAKRVLVNFASVMSELEINDIYFEANKLIDIMDE